MDGRRKCSACAQACSESPAALGPAPDLLPKLPFKPWVDAEVMFPEERLMAKIAKTADRKKVMDTSKSTDCPKCGKATRIVKRVKDRERGIPGGVFISCSACEFYEKL
jgi:hypothetical protein